MMLVSGVCMLRILREKRGGGIRQGLYMGAFVLLCAGLTLGHAPQLLLKGVGFVYRGVVAPLVFVLAVVIAAVFYVFYLLTAWIVARRKGQDAELNLSLESAAEALGLSDQYAAYTADLRWLKTLLIVLLCAVLAFLLFLLFRRLLGDRPGGAPRAYATERRGVLPGAASSEKPPGRIRPREPRLAVRYYFAHFVAECARRGLVITEGMTVTELCRQCAGHFPDAEVAALAEVYLPARYQLSRPVPRNDVRRAAEAWSALKRSGKSEGVAKKKNKP
jgi:hypothetical protein